MTEKTTTPEIAPLDEAQQAALEPLIQDKIRSAVAEATAAARKDMAAEVRAEVEKEIREEYEAKFDLSEEQRAELSQQFVEKHMGEMMDSAAAETRDLVAAKEALEKKEREIAAKYEADKIAAKAKLDEHLARLQEFVERHTVAMADRHAETEQMKRERLESVREFAEKELNKETGALAEDRAAFVQNVQRTNDFIIRQLGEKLAQMDAKSEAVDMELERVKAEGRRQINELAAGYEKKDRAKQHQLAEAVSKVRAFVEKQLASEIAEFKAHAEALEAEKAKLKGDYEKIVEFVEKRLKVEIDEMRADNQALVEQKVKLLARSEKMLEDTKREWLKEQAEKMQAFVEARYAAEMADLKDDIKEAKLNRFGRKIAEAFIVEAMDSGFFENDEVAQLKDQVAEANAQRNQARTIARAEAQKAKVAESSNERLRILSSLVGALPAGQRQLMEKVLEGTPTADLETEFKKHIDSIMKESPEANATSMPARQPQALVEGARARPGTPARRPRQRVVEVRSGDKPRIVKESAPEAGLDQVSQEVMNLTARLSRKFGTKKAAVPAA